MYMKHMLRHLLWVTIKMIRLKRIEPCHAVDLFFYSWEVASPACTYMDDFQGAIHLGRGAVFLSLFSTCVFLATFFFVTCNKPWGSVDIGSFVQCTFVPMLFVLGNEDHICL